MQYSFIERTQEIQKRIFQFLCQPFLKGNTGILVWAVLLLKLVPVISGNFLETITIDDFCRNCTKFFADELHCQEWEWIQIRKQKSRDVIWQREDRNGHGRTNWDSKDQLEILGWCKLSRLLCWRSLRSNQGTPNLQILEILSQYKSIVVKTVLLLTIRRRQQRRLYSCRKVLFLAATRAESYHFRFSLNCHNPSLRLAADADWRDSSLTQASFPLCCTNIQNYFWLIEIIMYGFWGVIFLTVELFSVAVSCWIPRNGFCRIRYLACFVIGKDRGASEGGGSTPCRPDRNYYAGRAFEQET